MRFKILKFINSHKNWRSILTSPPYNLKIRDDGNYTLIKYNQIFSDFREEMVREARGIILKKVGNKYKLVCVPYTKFFAIGDPNASDALFKLHHRKKWHVTEKIDGSLMKLWYDDGEWHLSTNGTIDASKVELTFPQDNMKTFYDMFMYASNKKIKYDKLDKQYTYMFELIGLENKVIVSYHKEELYYLGRRNNFTLKEVPYEADDCVGVEELKRPHHFIVTNNNNELKKLKYDINNLSKENTEHFEGYVIADYQSKYKVKAKSLEYMNLFYQKGNGFTKKKMLMLILDNKDDDVVSTFPEYKNQFDDIKKKLNLWLTDIKQDLSYMDDHKWETKKEFAEWAKTTKYPPITFAAYNNDYWADNWLENRIGAISIDNLLAYIEEEK